MGFVISESEASNFISADSRNSRVIYNYINGEDLNTNPLQRGSRYVINFWDWPELKASEFRLPYEHILKNVKPERQRTKENGVYVLRKPLPERWWQYADKRPGLYHSIGRGRDFDNHPPGYDENTTPQDKVLVCSEVTKYLAFVFVKNDMIMSTNLDVFSDSRFEHFAILQSNVHECWGRKMSSSLGLTMKYAPGKAYETFPFPFLKDSATLALAGSRYHDLRAEIMASESIGLTKIYNKFHSSKSNDEPIVRLRELQVKIDLEVILTYGWSDLDMGHDFHVLPFLPEHDNVRYSISDSARIELLRRLASLNRQRYEEEEAQGAHGDATPQASSRAKRASRASSTSMVQPSLDFESGAAMPINGVTPATAILGFLNTNNGWYAKIDVLAATGITDGQWNTAIAELIAGGKVERQGERRGARYRATDVGGAAQ